MTRGKVIVFEGAESSWNTTQSKRYADFLCKVGVPVAEEIPWRFPARRNGSGKMIDTSLKSNKDLDGHTIDFLFAANSLEKRNQLIDALNASKAVIVDRHIMASRTPWQRAFPLTVAMPLTLDCQRPT